MHVSSFQPIPARGVLKKGPLIIIHDVTIIVLEVYGAVYLSMLPSKHIELRASNYILGFYQGYINPCLVKIRSVVQEVYFTFGKILL